LTTTYIISLAIQLAVVIAVVVIVLLLVRPGRSNERSELEIEMNRLHDDVAQVRESVVNSLASQSGMFRTELMNATKQLKQDQPSEIPGRLAQLEQVIASLGKRLQEMQQDVAQLSRRSGEAKQEFKQAVREETQPLRNQLLDLAESLPSQVKQVAGALEPAVNALEGKLGHKHQAAIDLTLLQLTSALSQTETRLADTARRQELLVTDVKSDLHDINNRLAELENLLRALRERAQPRDAAPLLAAASTPRDSAIPLPSRVPPGPGTSDPQV
jgi:chromosome segregation ATPase